MHRYVYCLLTSGLLVCCTGESSDSDKDVLQNMLDTVSDTSPGQDTVTENGIGGDTNTSGEALRGSDNGSDAVATESDICVLPQTKYLSVDEVHEVWQNDCPNIVYLNVVDALFYDLGHIPGSIEIPWDSLPERLADVDKAQTIVIYCRRGVRSENAYDTLVNAGYPALYVMQDGIEPWIAAEYETVPIP